MVNQDGTLALARSFGPSASMAAGVAARCSSSATSIATKLVQSTPDILGVEVGVEVGACGYVEVGGEVVSGCILGGGG